MEECAAKIQEMPELRECHFQCRFHQAAVVAIVLISRGLLSACGSGAGRRSPGQNCNSTAETGKGIARYLRGHAPRTQSVRNSDLADALDDVVLLLLRHLVKQWKNNRLVGHRIGVD